MGLEIGEDETMEDPSPEGLVKRHSPRLQISDARHELARALIANESPERCLLALIRAKSHIDLAIQALWLRLR